MNMMGLHMKGAYLQGLSECFTFGFNILKATFSSTVARAASQPTVQTSSRESQQPNRQSLLPSLFLARRHLTTSNTNTTAKKRRVSGQIGKEKTYTKDIVCLLQQQYPQAVDNRSVIPIPRGKARGSLAELGLIGKVRLVSTWSSARVTDEITSVFSSSFDLEEEEQLQFKYLSVVPGAKVLSVAKVSLSFSWSGHAVASLAGQGCICIITEMQLKKTNLNQQPGEEDIKDKLIDAIPIDDSDTEHEIEVYEVFNVNLTSRMARADWQKGRELITSPLLSFN